MWYRIIVQNVRLMIYMNVRNGSSLLGKMGRLLRLLDVVRMESTPVVLPAGGLRWALFDRIFGRQIERGICFEF